MSTIQSGYRHKWGRSASIASVQVFTATVLTAGIFLAGDAHAAVDCHDGREATTFHIVIDTEVENLPPRLGYPGADSAEATGVTVQWPSAQLPEQAYMNEVFAIDLSAETVGLVDGIDGRARAQNPDIRALADDRRGMAETGLLDSDFGLGLINVQGCMDPARDTGLVFVMYASGSETVGFQVAPFSVRQADGGRVAVVAPNEGTSNQAGLEFNTTGVDAVMAIMEEASGTDSYDMARVNAENMYQETIPFLFNAENERNAKFGDAEQAIIHSDKVVVLGQYAQVRAADGVAVFRNGEEKRLFSARTVSGLRGYLDFYGKATLELDVAGYADRRVIQLLEGDSLLETEASDCTDKATITSEFIHRSPLKGHISLYDDEELVKQVEDQLDETVDCDGSVYAVVGERLLSGVDLPATEDLGHVFNDPDREFTFVGLDLNDDGVANRVDNDDDGILDGSPVSIGCNDAEPRKDHLLMDPPIDERTYTFTAISGPDGWGITAPNVVGYDANCTDAGMSVSAVVRANDGTTVKELTIRYGVTN